MEELSVTVGMVMLIFIHADTEKLFATLASICYLEQCVLVCSAKLKMELIISVSWL